MLAETFTAQTGVRTAHASSLSIERGATKDIAPRRTRKRWTADTFIDAGERPNVSRDASSTSSTADPGGRSSTPGSSRVTGMRKWEGTVLEVEGDSFVAKLVPSDHEGAELHAEFDVSDLAEDDREPVEEGDQFYLTVRSVRGRGRKMERTAALRMQRLGRWTEEELQTAAERAKSRAARIARYADNSA